MCPRLKRGAHLWGSLRFNRWISNRSFLSGFPANGCWGYIGRGVKNGAAHENIFAVRAQQPIPPRPADQDVVAQVGEQRIGVGSRVFGAVRIALISLQAEQLPALRAHRR